VLYPNCADIPALCGILVPGVAGAAGRDGAIGPQGDTGLLPPVGALRSVHPHGLCTTNLGCIYTVFGLQGVVGPQGDTGPKGDTGPYSITGPSRRPSRDGYIPGDVVDISLCELPSTGGHSGVLLAMGGMTLGLGAAALLVARRRRFASR
jgi:LPXTG-motif cell wall-anchored protein